MSNIVNELSAAGAVLTDGAWGTELQKRGLPVGEIPDLWNLTHPDVVAEVAAAYVVAGSRIILTNTFRSNRVSLEHQGLTDKVRQINLAGVDLSRGAAGDRAAVFASMGPVGTRANTSEKQINDAFREQADALAEGGADALIIETMMDLSEAKIALAATHTSGLPVVVCMVFNVQGDVLGDCKVTVEEAARELENGGAAAVGTNCGGTAAEMLSVVERLRRTTSLPVWVKPHAGLPHMENGRPVYRYNPNEFARDSMPLILAGANVIGGCCGTGPEHIRALAAAMSATGSLSL